MPEQHDEAAVRNPPKTDHAWSLAQRVQANRRSLQLTLLIVILFLVDFLWSVHTQYLAEQHAQQAIAAGCDFWEPLTSVPVTIPPGASKPTPLSVKILAGAREGYAGQCFPPRWPAIGPADPSLVRWGRFYKIPVVP